MQTPFIQETATAIPDDLVYEIRQGKPIYYKGYKEVLSGAKMLVEVRADTNLQGGLKARLAFNIGSSLQSKGYQGAVGKLGILLAKKDIKAADFAIFKAENWSWSDSFATLPPEVVIEIDVRVELENMTEMEYITEKVKDYLAFGVQKVIWIFSKEKLVFIATPQLPWLTYDWSAEIEVVEGITFKLDDIVPQKK